MVVLLPAHRMDQRLVDMVVAIRHGAPSWKVLVVDDGPATGDGVFAQLLALGATVLTEPRGTALKAGLAYAADHAPGETVVCADADGLYSVHDIVRVAAAVRPATMVLGGRRARASEPVVDRARRAVTSQVVRAVAGVRVHDVAPGLRAYPYELLDWLLTLPARGDHDLGTLLRARRAGVRVVEVEVGLEYDAVLRPVRTNPGRTRPTAALLRR